MEALLIKLCDRPGDKAVYHEARLSLLSKNQLHVIKKNGELDVVVLLPSDRTVSAVNKRGTHYVIVESSSKHIKIKAPSVQLQTYWVNTLSHSPSATLPPPLQQVTHGRKTTSYMEEIPGFASLLEDSADTIGSLSERVVAVNIDNYDERRGSKHKSQASAQHKQQTHEPKIRSASPLGQIFMPQPHKTAIIQPTFSAQQVEDAIGTAHRVHEAKKSQTHEQIDLREHSASADQGKPGVSHAAEVEVPAGQGAPRAKSAKRNLRMSEI